MSPVIVVCTGPESSGKSTLSQLLAEALQVPLVEEQARTYLDSKDAGRNGYLPSDILEIGRRQSDQENGAQRQIPFLSAIPIIKYCESGGRKSTVLTRPRLTTPVISLCRSIAFIFFVILISLGRLIHCGNIPMTVIGCCAGMKSIARGSS